MKEEFEKLLVKYKYRLSQYSKFIQHYPMTSKYAEGQERECKDIIDDLEHVLKNITYDS